MKLRYRPVPFCFSVVIPGARPPRPQPASVLPPNRDAAPVTDTASGEFSLPAPLASIPSDLQPRHVEFRQEPNETRRVAFATGYRFVVVKPLRIGIANAGHLVFLQGASSTNCCKAVGQAAGDETARCVCNTVLGLGGLFDVASRWDIPKPKADFGQTFKSGATSPESSLCCRCSGPSDVRDGTTSRRRDYAANPLSYFTPFSYISPRVGRQ